MAGEQVHRFGSAARALQGTPVKNPAYFDDAIGRIDSHQLDESHGASRASVHDRKHKRVLRCCPRAQMIVESSAIHKRTGAHIAPQIFVFRAAQPLPKRIPVFPGVKRFERDPAPLRADSPGQGGVSGKCGTIDHNLRNTKLHRRQFLGCGMSLLAASVFDRLRAADFSTRSIDLVAQSNVIDMLGLLTLDWPLLDRWQNAPGNFTEADFHKLRESGINVFHPAVAFEDARAYAITRAWFDKWNRLIDQHPAWFLRIDQSADLARAKAEGKIGIILGMQDANHLRNLDDLDAFYKMGQRLTQVTYNSQNRLGAGCTAARDQGLTEFGQAVIARMNAMGMAIDISHCGERTTLDTIAASKKPVLITHSNCRTLAPGVARCKTDEAIVAAARNGGVIGLTGVRHFVRAKDPVTLDDALNHFDHVVKIAGIEHVGVGSDTDLNGRGPQADIAGLNRVNRIFELTEGLIRRGYTDAHIGLILGGNFQRALQQIWT
jgi:membrane dipeptidase